MKTNNFNKKGITIRVLSALFLFLLILFSISCNTENKSKKDIAIIKKRIYDLHTSNSISISEKWKKRAANDIDFTVQKILNDSSYIYFASDNKNRRGPKISSVYNNLLSLSQAYNFPDQKYYRDSNMLNSIETGLKSTVQWIDEGSELPGNWFDWRIGTPKSMGPLMILMEDHLNKELFNKLIDCQKYLLTDKPYLSGPNAVWQGIAHLYRAILTEDDSLLAVALDFIYPEIVVTNTLTGILEDYSFQFHDQILYTGGYGSGMTASVAEIVYLTDGTQYEISQEKLDLFAKHILEHIQWTIVENYFDISVIGRGNKKPKKNGSIVEAILLLSQSPTKYQSELRQAASRLFLYSDISLYILPFIDLISNVESSPLTGFKYFYKSDYAVSRQKDYFLSVKMFSDKVMDFEYMHGQNEQGWNQSNGFTYFSRTGNEIWNRSQNLEKYYDWEHLPGTTSRLNANPGKYGSFSKSDFAGGAGSNSNGIVAFKLIPIVDDFSAKKSYFTFDGGFIALGSDITSNKKGKEVSTTITQWGNKKEDTPLTLSNGETITSPLWKMNNANLKWAFCDSVGYIFHHCENLYLKRDNFYSTIYINHGNNPQHARYSYTVLPACSEKDVKNYLEKSEIKILENSEKTHAVRSEKEQATGIVFWEPGKFDIISTNHQAIVYYKEVDNDIELTVCNPIYADETIEITIDKEFEEYDIPEDAQIKTIDHKTIVTLNTKNRRYYRIGLGKIKVQQGARMDNSLYEEFKIVNVESSNEDTRITLQIPEIVRDKNYRLMIYYWLGHRIKELTDADMVEDKGNGVYVYNWHNPDIWLKPHFNGKHNYNIRLNTKMHNDWEFFKVDRDGPGKTSDPHYR